MNLLITLAVGCIVGYIFYRLKIPGGMMVGALVGAVALNLATELAVMPSAARVAAQITAGGFVGASVEKKDVLRIPRLAKPALILLGGMLMVNMTMGIVIYLTSNVDWLTAFMCAVPGGMSDTPIIAAEMGANGAAVVLMQFCRLVSGIGVFPSVIMAVTRHEEQDEHDVQEKQEKAATYQAVLLTMAVAVVCGLLGRVSGIPMGTMLFSLLGTACLNIFWGKAVVPVWLKRVAQVLSGTYIGCSVGAGEVADLRFLLLPALLLVAGYLINCFVSSALLHKLCHIKRREAMLACSPAGATDMALISGDMGVTSPDLNVLQIVRMVSAITIFPQIIHAIVPLLP